MTALLSGRRRTTAPGAGLPERLAALRAVTELGTGRLDPALVAEARAVLDRAGQRLALSGEHTVVALAGATGSGKSSLFNSLAGVELSRVGVRRPTTGEAHACVWGAEGAEALLDWLAVPRRHRMDRTDRMDRMDRESIHGDGGPDSGPDALRGLVLLDLPDHDSTERSHRIEVDRLVELVDLLVWVVDPQKYADGALHERYLRPLAGHAAVTVIVLNQVDRLDPPAVEACSLDLRRLLREDGLGDVPVMPVSARTGQGVPELRARLADAVRRREAFAERISADLDRVTGRLSAEVTGEPGDVGRRERSALIGALATAAGVPGVGVAVQRSGVRRAAAATGWPFTRWVRRLRPDPLRRLHLEGAGGSRGASSEVSTVAVRSSLPAPTPVARSQVDTALRAVVEASAGTLPAWQVDAVRRAAHTDSADLADALDRAVTGTDLGVSRTPLWWRLIGAVQWLLALATVVGIVWLLLLFTLEWFQIPPPPVPDVEEPVRVPVPTLLAVGGALVGLLLAFASRIAARVGARRRRRRAESRLRESIAAVAETHVLAPVAAELEVFRRLRSELSRAARS